jgi:hypothetical protein
MMRTCIKFSAVLERIFEEGHVLLFVERAAAISHSNRWGLGVQTAQPAEGRRSFAADANGDTSA